MLTQSCACLIFISIFLIADYWQIDIGMATSSNNNKWVKAIWRE